MFLFYLLQNIFNVKFIIMIDNKKEFYTYCHEFYLGQWAILTFKSYIELVESYFSLDVMTLTFFCIRLNGISIGHYC